MRIRHFTKPWMVCLGLILLTMAVYLPVRHFKFITFDDFLFIYDNPYVTQGLTRESAQWALTADLREGSPYADYWRPVSFLSHILDVELFGLDAGKHHLVNMLFHLLNMGLLFHLLVKTTGQPYPSLFVVALFGLHPLQVESVAWVTERKDVLSVFLSLSVLLAWTGYVKKPNPMKYLTALVLFVLALMSKSMVVTLPAVMLLMDVWPFGRLRVSGNASGVINARFQGPGNNGNRKNTPIQLIVEKFPFFILSLGSMLIMTVLQPDRAGLRSLEAVPLGFRVSKALFAFGSYLRKMVWPHDLAYFYPPQPMPAWFLATSGLLLGVLTAWVLLRFRKQPYLFTGWFWFVVMLLPVIGIVNVGDEMMADRFMYMPKIGLLVMIAWGFAELKGRFWYKPALLIPCSLVLLVACTVMTSAQVKTWHDSLSLTSQALAVTLNNAPAHIVHGAALLEKNKTQEAFWHFGEAMRINPRDPDAQRNYGYCLGKFGETKKAVESLKEAIRLKPKDPLSHEVLSNLFFDLGKVEEGVIHLREAVKLDPDDWLKRYNLGTALANLDKHDEAEKQYRVSIRYNPENADTHNNLANSYLRQEEYENAWFHYQEAGRLEPGMELTGKNVANLLAEMNRQAWKLATHPDPQKRDGARAVEIAGLACEYIEFMDPAYLDTLAVAYAEAGRFEEAIKTADRSSTLAREMGEDKLSGIIQQHLEQFQRGEPVRE